MTLLRDLEPENSRGFHELALLEEACENKARAARYFNVAKKLRRDEERQARGRASAHLGEPVKEWAYESDVGGVQRIKRAPYSIKVRPGRCCPPRIQ
jgi:hypothetical protein